jgi:hypothetical protein
MSSGPTEPVSSLGEGLLLEQGKILARQRSFGEMVDIPASGWKPLSKVDIVDRLKNKTTGVLLLGIRSPFFKKLK